MQHMAAEIILFEQGCPLLYLLLLLTQFLLNTKPVIPASILSFTTCSSLFQNMQ